MSSAWSTQTAIDVLAADDLFLAVDVSLDPIGDRVVTGTQILDFIEDTLNSLSNDLNMNENNINNVNEIRASSDVLDFNDSSGAEILKVQASTTAVNHINIHSADTGDGPQINTSGPDADIDLRLSTKNNTGNGSLEFVKDVEAQNLTAAGRLQTSSRNITVNTNQDLATHGNVFQVSGTGNIFRINITDWIEGSIVVLGLEGVAITAVPGEIPVPPYFPLAMDGAFLSPGILTLVLAKDPNGLATWFEISRSKNT